ncbi:MAG: zinc-binding alcohol dehydrogenase family protein [Hydrocarboniphaga sp.]|uniref:zinc-binding alcohol dehydrogenase family protein n=1 Tax=Hydrocarboniphaga sp. TaxID=2033016 RepID=UPI0026126883|nr:zinc-binding alcohol dehydrogenase family protein [Hydrocarboniphaga sp.]MDB5969156.1 zinc-binding alcohol dehydrogenase family protein [Hydrocarboniphaga sp.]
MKAVGLTRYLPINDPESLIDIDLPMPQPEARDLLVRVETISVNPVDTKIRAPKDKLESTPRVLGWDAAGVVESVGSEATLFKPGDAVYYAGEIGRPGSNSQFQLADERLVGRKPRTLDFAQAAALPLTTITAYEALFERLGISADGADRGKSLLIIGAAGGVGSIALQLARLAGLIVIGTVGRIETRRWTASLGLQLTADHGQPLPGQLAALGHPEVDYVLNLNSTDRYWQVTAEVLRPQGKVCSIVENSGPLDQSLYKSKSLTHAWEFMFTRAMFKTADMIEQGRILNRVADWIDQNALKPTLTETLSPINAANLRRAHARLESGTTIGKLALSGWA